MANVKIVLDERRIKNDGTAPVKLQISHKSKVAMISLHISVRPEEFDKTSGQLFDKKNKQINTILQRYVANSNYELIRLQDSHLLHTMSINDLKEAIGASLFGEEVHETSLFDFIDKVMSEKRAKSTLQNYTQMLRLVKEYSKDVALANVNFNFVNGFNTFLYDKGYAVNTVNTIHSCLHNCMSRAIDEELIVADPYRKLKLKRKESAKLCLTRDKLLAFRDAELTGMIAYIRDMFMLSFYLIGMNPADMYKCKKPVDGRIQYNRSKTGKLYDVLVPKEAQEIIDRYSDDEYMIDMSRRYNSVGAFNTQSSVYLKRYLPDLTMYHARRTWATLAHEYGIQKDVISMGLGHSFGAVVTNAYINYKCEKVDEANRNLLDWLL